MALKEGKDSLYLIWKSFETRNQYVVGELVRNGQFEFSYSFDIEKAIKEGYEPIICFPDIDRVYRSDILFPIFSTRLPDKKRRDIDKILKKYNLDEYDSYTLLKRSGAKLPIDNYEFVDPIFDYKENEINRRFILAGTRHYIGCKGKECSNSIDIKENEELFLEREPDNKHDKYAIQIMNAKGQLLGYVPRYYSKGITKLIESGAKVKCTVYEVAKNQYCPECVRVIINVKN